jgi:signal transduction histidine kinase/FixJ family two-component response regulator/HPt (histidine-containing phosphotransfer) domain-containing protein
MDIADYIDEVVLSLVTKAINHVASIAEIRSDIDRAATAVEELNALIENGAAERDIAAKSGEMTKIAGIVLERAEGLDHETALISMDINEVMGSVEDLNAARLKSDRENRGKTMFLARMSHELRTPMNAIIGMSELAEREYGRPVCLEHIRDIKQAGANLLSIINDILDFSKMESGNFQITHSPYGAASVFNDVINITRVRLADSPVRLITGIDPDIPSKMTGDAGRVRQMLLNLLSNAVKYTKNGFIKFTASCEKEGETVLLRFAVEDSGVGIKQEDIGRLFGDFERADMERNTGIEGAGLGLSIARTLCRAMGGDISVESEYGKGSVFTASVRQSFGPCEPVGNIEGKTSADTRNLGVNFTAPGCRVLVVDDIDVNLKIAKGLLAPFEMKIDACSSGDAALSMVRENEYDLIFMDHMMPGMDGMETTAAIRAAPGEYFGTVPIIALTANAVSGMKDMFLENGFNDFLSKPIDVHRLYKLMERWVPREKRVKSGRRVHESDSTPETGLKIEGLDASHGLASTGGTVEGYVKVLEAYCRDADKRIEILSSVPDESGLAAFITQVHALKSASASVGADEISRFAAKLEEAGKNGDVDFIAARLSMFRENLSGLVGRIRLALVERAHNGESGVNAEKADSTYLQETLSRLRNALLAENVGEADAILKEFETTPANSKTKETLTAVAALVLTSEFGSAAGMIDDLRSRSGTSHSVKTKV